MSDGSAGRSVERFVVALAGGAALVYGASLAILFAGAPLALLLSPTTLVVAALLAGAYALFQFSPFELEWRGHWLTATLDETSLILGLLWLPGPAIVVLLPLAELGVNLYMGRPRVKGLFNVAQIAVASAAAWDVSRVAGFFGAPALLAAALAVPVYVATSNVFVAGVFARLENERTFRVYFQRMAPTTLALSSIGLAAGVTIWILAGYHPLAVLALAPFAFAVRRNTLLASRADRELKAQRELADAATGLLATWDVERIAQSVLDACGATVPSGRARVAIAQGGAWSRDFEGGPASDAEAWSTPIPGREGASLGEITLWPRPGQRAPDETDRALVRTLAGQAGAALLNAQAVRALEEGHARDVRHREQLARQEKLSSLGMLVANVSHEIGNPLSYLRLSVQTMKIQAGKLAANPDPDVRRAAESLQKSIATAQKGVDNVVEIANSLRSVARQGQAGFKPTDLNAIVKDVATVVRVGFPKDVKIELATLPEPALVNGNAGELTQVVLNLAKNAAEAIGERPGRVALRVSASEDRLCVEVADDGPGIPEETLARLFTPFFTTKDHGTGIGLHISRGIASAHAGELRCESVVGEGTRFTLELPALAADPTTGEKLGARKPEAVL